MNRRTALATALLSPNAMATTNPTPVADYLRANGAEAVFTRLQALAKPGADKYSAGWLLLTRRAGVPSCLASACADLGLATLGQVDEFVARLSLSYAEVAGLFPAVDIEPSALKPVNWLRIHLQATQQFAIAGLGDPDVCKFDHANQTYLAVPRAKLPEVAAKFPLRDADFYRRSKCEDKVAALRGWLVGQGLGDLAIGFAGLYLYTYGNNFLRSHAVGVAMDEFDTLWLLDGGVYPANFAKFTGNQDCISNKLARLYFL